MARGWESKSVEEQQAAASTQSRIETTTYAGTGRREAGNRKRFELSRRRVLQQLAVGCKILVIARCLKALCLSWIDQLARLG